MPSAFDRATPASDHSPLANQMSFDPALPLLNPIDILDQWIDSIQEFIIPLIKQLTGIDLSFLGPLIDGFQEFLDGIASLGESLGLGSPLDFIKSLFSAFDGIDITNPGSIIAAIIALPGNLIQKLIDVLLGAFTGVANPLGDLASLAQAFLNLPLQIGAQLFDSIFGTLAAFGAQLTGQQNNPGVAIGDDFATNTLSGRRTNVMGAMAISTRGKYLQTPNLAADYMGTSGAPRKPATVKCGSSITIGSVMNGVVRTWIHGDAAMTNYAALEVYSGFDGDALRIVSGAAPDLVVVQKQFDLGTTKVQVGNTFDLKFDPANNRYMVWRNNQDTGLFWADTSNVVTRSTGKLLTGAVTNGDDRNEDGFYGPGISRESFYDW